VVLYVKLKKKVKKEMQEFIDGEGYIRVVIDQAINKKTDRRRYKKGKKKC